MNPSPVILEAGWCGLRTPIAIFLSLETTRSNIKLYDDRDETTRRGETQPNPNKVLQESKQSMPLFFFLCSFGFILALTWVNGRELQAAQVHRQARQGLLVDLSSLPECFVFVFPAAGRLG